MQKIKDLYIYSIIVLFLGLLYWLGFYLQSRPDIDQTIRFLEAYILRAVLSLLFFLSIVSLIHSHSLTRHLPLQLIFCPLFVITWLVLSELPYGNKSSFLNYNVYGNNKTYDTLILYILQFGLFYIYRYFKDQKLQQIKEMELLQLAHQSEISTLKGQIQPHFLFNTLNSINASIPAHLEYTRELIARLADMYRYTLKVSQLEVISIKEELAFIKSYIDLQNLNPQTRFYFSVHPALLQDPIKISPMILYSIVSNYMIELSKDKLEECRFSVFPGQPDEDRFISLQIYTSPAYSKGRLSEILKQNNLSPILRGNQSNSILLQEELPSQVFIQLKLLL